MWITYYVSEWGISFITDNLEIKEAIANASYSSDCYWMVPGTVDPNDD